jgi:hypothetical protein
MAAGIAVSVTSRAAAECPYVPDFPPITGAIRSASEIIVGEVTTVKGIDWSTEFDLRIDHVLRGDARVGDVRHIVNLEPHWPYETFNGHVIESCTLLRAHPGDVIGIAYDALAPDGHTRYNAAGWLKGSVEGFQQTTLARIESLAALPETDAVVPGPDHQKPSEPPAIPILLGTLTAVLSLRRLPVARRPW